MRHRTVGGITFAALLAVIIVTHLHAVRELVEFWGISLVYDHGALLFVFVTALAAYELSCSKPFSHPISRRSAFGLVFFGTSMVTATLADIMLGQMILMPLLLWFGIATVFGDSVARPFAWLFAALIFSWPIWDFLIEPLQSLTIYVTNGLLEFSHRTAFIENDTVILRHGAFVIERGCAGLNFFLAGTVLGVIFGFWFLHSLKARLFAIASAVALSVLANWIRVFVIIMAGDLTEMQHSLVADHEFFGWSVFAVIMTLSFVAGAWLQKNFRGDDADEPAANTMILGKQQTGPEKARPWQRAVAVAAMLIFPQVAAHSVMLAADHQPEGAPRLPEVVSTWVKSEMTPKSNRAPFFPGAVTSISAVYDGKEGGLDVWLSAYTLENDMPEMVGYPNAWFQRSEWKQLPFDASVELNIGSISGPEIRKVGREGQTRIVFGGYVFQNRVIGSDLEAKLHRALARLRGENRALALTVSRTCEFDCAKAEKVVAAFVQEIRRSGTDALWLDDLTQQ